MQSACGRSVVAASPYSDAIIYGRPLRALAHTRHPPPPNPTQKTTHPLTHHVCSHAPIFTKHAHSSRCILPRGILEPRCLTYYLMHETINRRCCVCLFTIELSTIVSRQCEMQHIGLCRCGGGWVDRETSCVLVNITIKRFDRYDNRGPEHLSRTTAQREHSPSRLGKLIW